MINNAPMRRPLKKTALASILFAGAMLAVAVTAEAQQPKKVPRIGFLASSTASSAEESLAPFRQRLHNLATWRERTSSWSTVWEREILIDSLYSPLSWSGSRLMLF